VVGHATRVAVVTTFTGMLFRGHLPGAAWQLSVLVAVSFVLFSLLRLVRTAAAWERAQTRALVVCAVAG
jgi:hypothetical protein